MPASFALVNGPIFTGLRDTPFATAVAVRGDKIVYVGDEKGVKEHVGVATTLLDLSGRLAVPGLQDAHCHPDTSGIDMGRCSLNDAHSAEEVLQTVARYAADHPLEDWILGSGWSQDSFHRGCPSKEALDAVVPDRPVYLPNRDGHSGWVNSVALRLAGIDVATPDPPDGRIERNSDGSAQGTLHEGARYLITRLLPAPTVDDVQDGLLAAQAFLFSKGITSWQDAHVEETSHRAYLSLGSSGKLSARVAGALWWDRHRGLDQIDELVHMAQEQSANYRPVGVKLMLDGVIENFTASMLNPYGDGRGGVTANHGIDFIDPHLLKQIVAALDSRGLSCHFHAIGDGGVRNALDAVEHARVRNGRNSNRHHVAHIQVVHPVDLPRFAELEVTANCQTLWACDGGYQTDLTKPFLGPERTGWQYPFASIQRFGGRLAMGSDWDVSTPDVFLQADVAVTRSDVDHPNEPPLNSAEAISLMDSLLGFTVGSAYVNHLDHMNGSIEIGKQADIVLLDCNPFERDRPAGTLVDVAFVGGDVVYER